MVRRRSKKKKEKRRKIRVGLIEEIKKSVLSGLCLERDGRRGQVVLEGFFLDIWQVHSNIDNVLEKGLGEVDALR